MLRKSLLASTLFGLLVVAHSSALQGPSPLGLYTFSRDSEAGFGDDKLDLFRNELGKLLEGTTELAYDRRSAAVSVQLLGSGELQVELAIDGAHRGYLWRADRKADQIWAIVHIGGFSKEFVVEGSGGRSHGRLAQDVADWLRTNAPSIHKARE